MQRIKTSLQSNMTTLGIEIIDVSGFPGAFHQIQQAAQMQFHRGKGAQPHPAGESGKA